MALVLCLDSTRPLPVHTLSKLAADSFSGGSCRDGYDLDRMCFSAQQCSTMGETHRAPPEFGAGWIIAQDASGYCGSLRVSPLPAHIVKNSSALFISDLCVVKAKRRGGIGRLLLESAISQHPSDPLALTVQLPSTVAHSEQSAAERVVKARYPLLLHFYTSMGFRFVHASDDLALLWRAPSP